MKLNYDREVTLSVGNSRKDTHWQPCRILISDLWERLRTPHRGVETVQQYFALKKSEQDNLKDVGGFVGGPLDGERRKASAVAGRDLVTLDFDTIPPYETGKILDKIREAGFAAAVYSTRKHLETAPRLRILIPLDRTVTADEYEPIARRLAEWIGIEHADPSTFEASRLMYWPSCCADGVYVFEYYDAPLCRADHVLQSYGDWHDIREWPQVPGKATDADRVHRMAARQGDPMAKDNIVGAFCRAYGSVQAVMDELLPGVYEQVPDDPNRYTFLGGSTTGGAVVYEDGKFLYSHHATDPCSGQLVNAFDLVRLHRFGDLDDDAVPGTPNPKLPSYAAMCEFANNDRKCALQQAHERQEKAEKEFTGVTANGDSAEWQLELEKNPKTGKPYPTINNILIILKNDPKLKGRFALNEFAGRGEIRAGAELPWEKKRLNRRLWSDTDSNGLYWYMEDIYGIERRGAIDAALDVHAADQSFNEVQEYLERVELGWDGVPRLDTLLIDYLGARDDPDGYVRAVTRKAFTAAAARAMDPGCKYDNMLILCGPQGIGKSTLLDRMSRGWFNDSIRTFEGKDASELLQGVWLVEVAELDAFRRTDVSRIKQFLSLRADRYRAAYGRNVRELPRRCVFFGTCNQTDFLQDTTGNRRFWPVDVGKGPKKYRLFHDLTPDVVDQIWAEAMCCWRLGETLYLNEAKVEAASVIVQDAHRDIPAWLDSIQEFAEREVPDDWMSWNLDRRRDFWSMAERGVLPDSPEYHTLRQRDRICPLEVWLELMGGLKRDYTRTIQREITNCLMQCPGWIKATKNTRISNGKDYGMQRIAFLREGGEAE